MQENKVLVASKWSCCFLQILSNLCIRISFYDESTQRMHGKHHFCKCCSSNLIDGVPISYSHSIEHASVKYNYKYVLKNWQKQQVSEVGSTNWRRKVLSLPPKMPPCGSLFKNLCITCSSCCQVVACA